MAQRVMCVYTEGDQTIATDWIQNSEFSAWNGGGL